MSTIADLKKIVDENKDLDICFNSNGAKIGVKGTNQSLWKRINWKSVTTDKVRHVIKKMREEESMVKTSPSLFIEEEEEEQVKGAHVGKGGDGDRYLKKYCKKLPKRDAAYLEEFYNYAKKEGYLPNDTTVDDAKELCEAYKSFTKK